MHSFTEISYDCVAVSLPYDNTQLQRTKVEVEIYAAGKRRERAGVAALSNGGTSGFLMCVEKRATAHETRRACSSILLAAAVMKAS